MNKIISNFEGKKPIIKKRNGLSSYTKNNLVNKGGKNKLRKFYKRRSILTLKQKKFVNQKVEKEASNIYSIKA